MEELEKIKEFTNILLQLEEKIMQESIVKLNDIQIEKLNFLKENYSTIRISGIIEISKRYFNILLIIFNRNPNNESLLDNLLEIISMIKEQDIAYYIDTENKFIIFSQLFIWNFNFPNKKTRKNILEVYLKTIKCFKSNESLIVKALPKIFSCSVNDLRFVNERTTKEVFLNCEILKILIRIKEIRNNELQVNIIRGIFSIIEFFNCNLEILKRTTSRKIEIIFEIFYYEIFDILENESLERYFLFIFFLKAQISIKNYRYKIENKIEIIHKEINYANDNIESFIRRFESPGNDFLLNSHIILELMISCGNQCNPLFLNSFLEILKSFFKAKDNLKCISTFENITIKELSAKSEKDINEIISKFFFYLEREVFINEIDNFAKRLFNGLNEKSKLSILNEILLELSEIYENSELISIPKIITYLKIWNTIYDDEIDKHDRLSLKINFNSLCIRILNDIDYFETVEYQIYRDISFTYLLSTILKTNIVSKSFMKNQKILSISLKFLQSSLSLNVVLAFKILNNCIMKNLELNGIGEFVSDYFNPIVSTITNKLTKLQELVEKSIFYEFKSIIELKENFSTNAENQDKINIFIETCIYLMENISQSLDLCYKMINFEFIGIFIDIILYLLSKLEEIEKPILKKVLNKENSQKIRILILKIMKFSLTSKFLLIKMIKLNSKTLNILENLPMEILSDDKNFSTNDLDNASISNSSLFIFEELFPLYMQVLKKTKNSYCFVAVLEFIIEFRENHKQYFDSNDKPQILERLINSYLAKNIHSISEKNSERIKELMKINLEKL